MRNAFKMMIRGGCIYSPFMLHICYGKVAQIVARPREAGKDGGASPSLATTIYLD